MEKKQGPTPELGNLAWAPLAAADNVEIYDRFNGVPSLGVVTSSAESYLFWRASFYLDDVSLWLYVPLMAEDLTYLEADDDSDPMEGIVFQSAEARFTTVGVAYENRLVFEREWWLPKDATPSEVSSTLLEFAAEALIVALDQEPPLPASRRDVVQKASEAVRHLCTT